MRVLLAVAAVVFCVSAEAQVSVSESGTRAHLVNGQTTIRLAIQNKFNRPVAAKIDLKWLDPTDKVDAQEVRPLVIDPGDFNFEIALPLNDKIDPLEERLLYAVIPDYENLTTFPEIRGMLSLPNIAGYAFNLRVVNFNLLRPGEIYEMRVLTTHPITGAPVAGVRVAWDKVEGMTDANGIAVLPIRLEADQSLSDHPVVAKLGDFERSIEPNGVDLMNGNLTIQIDKPMYQPGQTMHVRILSFGANGKAAVGAEHEIEIENEDGDVEHAVSVKTSAYGIAATDWEIPTNAKAGLYQINVESADDGPRARRTVTVRKYELPQFRVTAHGQRSYYLPHEKATLAVSAEYLFGKSLKSGTVRITEGENEDGVEFAKGLLGADGTFRTSFVVQDKFSGDERFHDRHFITFVTDGTTNRTEQKKFDLRISREALHAYVAKQESMPEGQRIYVTTYSPDGTTVKADVAVLAGKKVVARGRSNRFGITRLDLGKVEGEVRIRVTADDGRNVELKTEFAAFHDESLWLIPERRVYKQGEAIRLEVKASRKNLTAQVLGWNKQGRVLFTRAVKIENGMASLEIPYAADFGRELGLAALAGPIQAVATATLIFPGSVDLKLKAAPVQKTYAPGETAKLTFSASAQAALGIAVVDQSVMERAATDEAFGKRHWFNNDDDGPSLGDLPYSDLLNMDPAKIDGDIELLAQLLIPELFVPGSFEDSATKTQNAYKGASSKTLAPLAAQLDQRYLQTLAYPRDEVSFAQMGDASLRDPWLKSYRVRFSVRGAVDVMELCSNGPDKLPDTEDDFCLWEMDRKWFARYESLIGDALGRLEDYPATTAGVLKVIDEAGLHFGALRDPWQMPLRLEMGTSRDRRVIRLMSAGPDRKFGTADDFPVCTFQGTYFSKRGKKIQRKIDETGRFPQPTLHSWRWRNRPEWIWRKYATLGGTAIS